MLRISPRLAMSMASLAAVAIAAGALGLHFNEPVGILEMTVNGHTYRGSIQHPPALTLFERDQFSVIFAGALVSVVLIAAWTELVVRTLRGKTGVGSVAIAAGGLLALLSFFGLVYGVVTLGTLGALVVWSGVAGVVPRDVRRVHD
jgi:ABC-type uncharacterized transport system permease subunit